MRCDGNPTPLFFKSEKLRGSSNRPYIFQNVILALLFVSISLQISHEAMQASVLRIIEDSRKSSRWAIVEREMSVGFLCKTCQILEELDDL